MPGVGFAGIASQYDVLNIPMVLKYGDTGLPFLELAALERAFGQPARVYLGDKVTLAARSLPVDASGRTRVKSPAEDRIDSISSIAVLKGTSAKGVAGKTVILGFDAKETPALATTMGPFESAAFLYSLESLYEQLKAIDLLTVHGADPEGNFLGPS